MKFLKIHINNYIYILYMSGNVNEVKKIKKLNQYFYMTPEGDILKYKKYCIINNCKKSPLLIILVRKNFYIVMITN